MATLHTAPIFIRHTLTFSPFSPLITPGCSSFIFCANPAHHLAVFFTPLLQDPI
jgi:hypothetical protein